MTMKSLSEQGSVAITVRVTVEMRERLATEAHKRGVTPSEVLRDLIEGLDDERPTRTRPERARESVECEHEWKNVGWATICDKCRARR